MIGFRQFAPLRLMVMSALIGGLVLAIWLFARPSPQPVVKPAGVAATMSAADYRLEWQSGADEAGRALLPDEVFAYSAFLKRVLSGRLAASDPRRIEVQARSILSSAPKGVEPHQAIRLQSRIRPKLVLRNHSLAVFEVDTDYLHIRYDQTYTRFLDSRVRTMTETIRVADTRLGLVVRHIEAVGNPVDFTSPTNRQLASTKRLGGVNYYPASAPWTDFWAEFPVAEIEADFARIKALGANSVRVFLNRQAFEAPMRRQQSLGRLTHLLDLAQAHDLQVILTCFDMGVSYELADLTQSWAHLQRILDIAGAHPAVALIDLKNEPDLDYDHWSASRVDLWLSTLLQLGQAAYPDLSFTIGWSNAGAASALATQVDIVSFHDFESVADLSDRIAQVEAAAAGKPVMLTEIGHSRWPSLPGRKLQADKLSQQLNVARGLDGVLIWTLNDFEHIPDEVAGWRPWRKAMQAHYGLSPRSREHVSRFLCDFLNIPANPTCIGDTA